MAYRASTLVRLQPIPHKRLVCTIVREKSSIELTPVFVRDSIVFGTGVRCVEKVWNQIVTLPVANMLVYFTASIIDKALERRLGMRVKEDEPDVYVYFNNLLYDWQQRKDTRPYRILTDVLELILDGKIGVAGETFRIYLPKLSAVVSVEDVPVAVRELYNRIRNISKMSRENIVIDPVVKVFCDCPFFQYWGTYFLSQKGKYGLHPDEAEFYAEGIDVSLWTLRERTAYRAYPRSRRYVSYMLRDWRTGKVYKAVRTVADKAFGVSWSAYNLCKHLYTVIRDRSEIFTRTLVRAQDDIRVAFESLLARRLAKPLKLTEAYVGLYEINKDLMLLEYGRIMPSTSDFLQVGVEYIAKDKVIIPRYVGATQSKKVVLPKNAIVQYCCKLRGPEPPFHRFVAKVKDRKIEFDIPENEIGILFNKLKPKIKVWRGVDYPEILGVNWAI